MTKTTLFQCLGDDLTSSDIHDVPASVGAYALLIRLPRRLKTRIGALRDVNLPIGDYLYLGSAYGPGGLRARLRRHLRADKQLHWHVDFLTTAGAVIGIVAQMDDHECDMVRRVLHLPGITVPIPGFGNSDCRRCPAHMLAIGSDRKPVLAALTV